MGMTSTRALSLSCAALIALSLGSAAWAAPRNFDVAAQDAVKAIPEFGRQAGVQVVAPADRLKGIRTLAVRGALEVNDALAILLHGTGLEVASNDGRVIVLRMAADAEPAKQAADASDASSDKSEPPVEKVVVTGTRIPGAKASAPVITITQEDMRRQGHTDLGQVVRALPQSFGGGQNPGVTLGAGAGGINNSNTTGSSSINLRGLGQDATLTLLNGTRLPYDGFTQATDVAVVPIAAIDRLEILLDGASAIYGSDAVGGVANIILKRDYDGVEVSARYGKATEGGFEQQQYTGVGGTHWETGGFLATYDFNRNTKIEAGDRDYLSYMPAHAALYSPSTQKGGLFSGHQQFGDSVELTLDAFYTERASTEYQAFASIIGINVHTARDSEIWGIAPALRFTLPGDWSLRLHGSIGQNESEQVINRYIASGTLIGTNATCDCNKAEAAGVEAEGPLFDLPGGEARLAVGGGYRRNKYQSVELLSNTVGTQGSSRSHYVYGEVNLPLVAEEQAIPLVHRLSINGAVRYEDYDAFGETTTPKVGAVWGLTDGFDVKASWGKSFKAPTLQQQYSSSFLDLTDPMFLGDPTYPVGSGVLLIQGGNAALTPEKAEVVTAGFVARPDFLPGFRMEFSWFDIDYTDRVAMPFTPFFTALVNPAGLDYVIFNPTVAQQNAAFALVGEPVGSFPYPPPPYLLPYDPARIVAIADARYVNAAAQHASGIDLTASYTTDLFDGSFTASGNATWLESTQKVTPIAPEQEMAGNVFFPADFRGRIGASWYGDGLTLSTTVNYTAGVTNNVAPPFGEGEGMTTVDLVVDYVWADSPLGNETEFTFAVQNLFNQEPPFMQAILPIHTNFDSTNYSAIGRVVNVTVTQRF
jgi:outer membrane receptor protein involved in Fe transport